MLNIDMKDKRILYGLDLNSREFFSKIAKNARISEQSLNYRIQNFENKGIIKKYLTIMDFSRYGYSNHKICFRLKNLTPEKKEEIIKYWKKHKSVFWIGISDGRFDLSVAIIVKTMFELSNYLDGFNDIYGEFVQERKIVNVLQGEYCPRNYLIDKKNSEIKKRAGFGSIPDKIGLDKVDFIILKQLDDNARTSKRKIAETAKVSEDTITSRIKKLEQAGIIQGYTLMIDENKIGMTHYKLLISLRNIASSMQKALIEYCRQHPNVFFFNKTLGEWDMEVDFEVNDNEHMRNIMMEINKLFSGVIQDFSILNIYDQPKYNFLPMDYISK